MMQPGPTDSRAPETPGGPPTGAGAGSACYLTDELPPIGGRIRERPEDFLVDEQPLYEPSGDGEHIYLLVEKRNLSTLHAARILARHFGVHTSAVGYAGLKDKIAITRQVFSVHTPGRRADDFPMLQHERMVVLWADQHTNKLRRGHLAGNRFSIKIRKVPMSAALHAHRALQRLEQTGIPNRIGEQRFGYTLRNHLVGRAMLLGDHQAVLDAVLAPVPERPDVQAEARSLYAQGRFADALGAFSRELCTERRLLGALARGATALKAVRMIERDEELFYLTAFQSEIFNRVLDQRLASGMLDHLHAGDVAFKHDNRALFSVVEADLQGDQGSELRDRVARFEVSPTGPMWGAHMKRAAGAQDELELLALAETGITTSHLAAYDQKRANRITGERRPLRVPLRYPDVEGGVDEHGSYIRVAFDLPRGAFATTVLRELMKPERSGANVDATADPDDPPLDAL